VRLVSRLNRRFTTSTLRETHVDGRPQHRNDVLSKCVRDTTLAGTMGDASGGLTGAMEEPLSGHSRHAWDTRARENVGRPFDTAQNRVGECITTLRHMTP
jgi:hypothetical protein